MKKSKTISMNIENIITMDKYSLIVWFEEISKRTFIHFVPWHKMLKTMIKLKKKHKYVFGERIYRIEHENLQCLQEQIIEKFNQEKDSHWISYMLNNKKTFIRGRVNLIYSIADKMLSNDE